MHALITWLYPICRSVTGDGRRETLRIIRENHSAADALVRYDLLKEIAIEHS